MPKLTKRRSVKEKPEYRFKGWSKGLDTYQSKNKISKDAMSDCQNIEINIGSVEKRLGTQYVGNAKDSRTRGLALYSHTDGTKNLIRTSGDSLQEYNILTGDYEDVTGKTYTSDLNTDYIQAFDSLYVFNGTDNLTKYDKDDTPKITVFTEISPPTNPAAARDSGLSAGQYTAYFKLTHYNAIGETTGTNEFTVTYDKHRTQWNGSTEKLNITWTVDAGVDATGGTNIYFSDTSGDETFVDTVSGTTATWSFLGGEIEPDGITEVPESNSTGGPIAFKGDFDGTRLWCFKNSTVYYSGGGAADIEHFDSSSGGGALGIARGDGDSIQHLRRMRDGSIICYKKYSIWKISFSTTGIIQLQLVNPLIGAVGMRAVTSVDDDQIFVSPYGIFTLGNQPNFPTDILRIASISLPIDKELEKVTPDNLANVVIHYDFKRRIRVAVTEGGSTYNNVEYIFKYGAWTRNTNVSINCYLNLNDKESGTPIIDELNKRYTLYGSDDEGRVIQVDKGKSDRGAAIEAYFDTLVDDQGFYERYKKYYDQDVELGKLQGILNIYQYFDDGTRITAQIDNSSVGGMGSEAIGLSATGLEYGELEEGSTSNLTKRWRLYGRQQKNIRTRFYQNSAIGSFSILSFSGVYRLKSRRQYDSEDILQVTES